jgi:hypothetical protein
MLITLSLSLLAGDEAHLPRSSVNGILRLPIRFLKIGNPFNNFFIWFKSIPGEPFQDETTCYPNRPVRLHQEREHREDDHAEVWTD